MHVVQIFALSMQHPKPFFERTFAREADADDYCNYWLRLGSCSVRKVKQ